MNTKGQNQRNLQTILITKLVKCLNTFRLTGNILKMRECNGTLVKML